MRKLVLWVVAASVAIATPALMPMPAHVEAGQGWLTIDHSFTVNSADCRDPRMGGAVIRLINRISRQTGIFIDARRPTERRPGLTVVCGKAGADVPTLGEDESYQLVVTSDDALIRASTGTGALRALETFAQLVEPGPSGFRITAVHISDAPRFPWRGLMLDSSRHWMPVEVVKRNIDAMSAVKLNVFHWHLSDDQGFRVESKSFPRLQELGSDGYFYTQAQIRDVVAYAHHRGIRVIPEFDIPGHTLSWLVAYPELASAPGPYEIGRKWGGYEAVMDPSREETYQFLDTFIGEMAGLFPDAYFHIGGDEVNPKQWNESKSIQTFARLQGLRDAHAIQAYFNQRIQKILAKYGKTMIGWDEILHPDLPPSIVIQSWRGQQALADTAKQGRRGILSWGYYLDHLRPASYHYSIDPVNGAAAQLTPEQSANILGGEACMWAEFVSAETVDSRIWPRAAAVAERLWSPKDVNDSDSMYARLEVISRELESVGVQHRATYNTMLDRLTGGRTAEAVRVLASVSEAQGLGPRARARDYTSLVPLNRFVDAIPAESERVRNLEAAARSARAADIALLRQQFLIWLSNDGRFQALVPDNPMIAELQSLSRDLSALGAIGIRALDFLESGQMPPANWVAEQNRDIARMQKPTAEVVLAAARPVKVLLDHLGGAIVAQTKKPVHSRKRVAAVKKRRA